MNDKDKEAFEKWWMEGFKGMSDMEVIKYVNVGKQTSLHGWQAACEYKQKEIDELEESLATRFAKSYVAGKDLSKIIQKNLTNEVEKLQAENAKLRECVEFYADKLNWYDNTQINGSDQKAIFKDAEDCLIKSINKHIIIGGKRARQVLKELGDK